MLWGIDYQIRVLVGYYHSHMENYLDAEKWRLIMEEINQRSERKKLWENVRKQVQINLIQQRNGRFVVSIFLIVYILLITVLGVISFYTSKEVEYYSVFYGYSGFVWMGMICILILTHQLFTNGAISMYPGNAFSRYLGRCLADHIQFFLYLLCVALTYMVQCGLLWLLLQGKTELDISVIFDIRYLVVGLLRFAAYGMALYGVSSLFMALSARFGNRFIIVSLVVIFGCVYYSIRHRSEFMMLANAWILEGQTELFPYIGIFLLIWLLCILASGILACYVRCWRIVHKGELITILFAVFVVYFGSVLVTDPYAMSELGVENSGTQFGEEDLYSYILIKLPQNNAYDINEEMAEVVDSNTGKNFGSLYQYINNRNNLGFSIGSKSEAKEMGIPEGVDLSGIDEEYGLMIFQLHDVRINGQYIYRDLVKDMQKNLSQVEDNSQIKLEYAGNLKSTICFDFFPSADYFLYHGSQDMMMKEYYHNQPYFRTTLLMSDARYEAYEEWMDEELGLDE